MAKVKPVFRFARNVSCQKWCQPFYLCNYQPLTLRVNLLPLLQCRTQCFTCCLTFARPELANFNTLEGHVIRKYLLEGCTSVYMFIEDHRGGGEGVLNKTKGIYLQTISYAERTVK
jgi:hypothetical protein